MRLFEWTIERKVHTTEITLETGIGNGKTVEEKVMNTLHTFRKFALVAALATGALIASASPAGEVSYLGSMVVTASRASEAQIADLGSITVSASRLADTHVADLGSITVNASRIADTRFASLGGMTVTARRINTLTVATAESSVHSWE